jgi:hypothetical protein
MVWQTILANLGLAKWFGKPICKYKCQINLANHLGKSRSGKMVWQNGLANQFAKSKSGKPICHI